MEDEITNDEETDIKVQRTAETNRESEKKKTKRDVERLVLICTATCFICIPVTIL